MSWFNTCVKTDYAMRGDMDAFTAAWNVLKSNTIPIRPRVMQYATDPKKTMRLEQTGGVARRAREKLMDEVQAERNHEHRNSLSEGETDVMNQDGYGGRDREYRDSYKTFRFPDLYGNSYYEDIAARHPSVRFINQQDVMNQMGREQTPEEDKYQYEQMLEHFQNQKELEELLGHSIQEGPLDIENYPVSSSKAKKTERQQAYKH